MVVPSSAETLGRRWLRDQLCFRLYGNGERTMVDSNKLVFSNVSFDPETVNLLSDAFETTWQRVQTSGNRLARPGYAKVMREVMARQIINLAQHGERDETELSDSAVIFFTANYKA